jgi:DNA-binding response OmpR family regulator
MKILLASAHDCLIKPVDDNELLLRITALQPRPRNRQRSLPQPELSIFHHS